jgi:hypothetical protein
MPIQSCPCCSDRLLMHVRHSGVYWFCRHCWQEMPIAAAVDYQSIATALNAPTLRQTSAPPSLRLHLSSSLERVKRVRQEAVGIH